MKGNSTLVSTLIGAVIVIAGIYVAWKLIKAVEFVLIAVASSLSLLEYSGAAPKGGTRPRLAACFLPREGFE